MASEHDKTLQLLGEMAQVLADVHGSLCFYRHCVCSSDSEFPSECEALIVLAKYEQEARRG